MADAVTCLTDHTWGLGISARRITISTAGLASRIKDVAPLEGESRDLAQRHDRRTAATDRRAATGSIRFRPCSPPAARTPLGDRDRLTFEYVLLAEVNDRAEDATASSNFSGTFDVGQPASPSTPFPGSAYQRHPMSPLRRFKPSSAGAVSMSTFVEAVAEMSGRLWLTRRLGDRRGRLLTHRFKPVVSMNPVHD